ncbi:MAG: phosphoribosyltransferase [Nanoarchaeota archaeon]|nr:phosphoribosyltransferase [Nanoarchaeota archaeon]
MTYKSLFDNFYPNASSKFMNYEDTLEKLLKEFEELKTIGSLKPIDILVLYPPRIIRAVIDYKIYNPQITRLEDLLQKVINFSLNIYSQSFSDISKEVRNLKEYIATNFPDLLKFKIIQDEDKYTWLAMNPQKADILIAKLVPIIKSKDILFIALAHGGTASGLDVYLRIKDFVLVSNFYSVKFSRRKSFNKIPQLSSTEILNLKELAKNKQVIIYDEDVASGNTKKIAISFFSDLFGKEIYFVSSLESQITNYYEN